MERRLSRRTGLKQNGGEFAQKGSKGFETFASGGIRWMPRSSAEDEEA